MQQLTQLTHKPFLFSILGSALVVSSLAACGPAPSATGNFKAEINGVVQREPGQPMTDSRVALITESGQEVASLRTNSNGGYAFQQLAAGTYRVRFSQTDDVTGKPVLEFRPEQEPRTNEFFAQVTSQPISFNGQSTQSFTVSAISTLWKPDLNPTGGGATISTNRFPVFSWQPTSQARSYAVELLNPDGSLFYRSPDQSATTFEYRDLKGNQGSFNGLALQKGSQYYYRVRANLNPGNTPGPEYGVSAGSLLTIDAN